MSSNLLKYQPQNTIFILHVFIWNFCPIVIYSIQRTCILGMKTSTQKHFSNPKTEIESFFLQLRKGYDMPMPMMLFLATFDMFYCIRCQTHSYGVYFCRKASKIEMDRVSDRYRKFMLGTQYTYVIAIT